MFELQLRRSRGVYLAAIFDSEDRPWIQNLPSLGAAGRAKPYATCQVTYADGTKGKFNIARLIAGLAKGDTREVDHINGFTLDNRRENLRIVTRQGQQQNLRPQKSRKGVPTSSQYRGVHWSPSRGKWVCGATVLGESIYGGQFSVEEEAAEAAAHAREMLLEKAYVLGRLPRPAPCPPLAENPVLAAFLVSFDSGHWASRRTHCKHGHEYTPENTKFDKRQGFRVCVACGREKVRKRSAAKGVTALQLVTAVNTHGGT